MTIRRTIGAAALVLCVVLGAGVLLARLAGWSVAPVLTGSMVPAFAPGDLIVTRTVPVRDVEVGDVAVFVPPGETSPYAHRVVELTGSPTDPTVRTKGDANPTRDAWTVTFDRAEVPVVVAALPSVGRWFGFTTSPLARALVTALVGLLLTAYAVRLVLTVDDDAATAAA